MAVKTTDGTATQPAGPRSLTARLSRIMGAADEATLDVAVLTALEELGRFTSTDCAFATLVDDEDRVGDEWHWCRPGCAVRAPEIGSPLQAVFGSAMEFLRIGHTMAVADLNEVELGPSERAMATINELRAILIVPVRIGTTLLGVVGLHVFGRARTWDEPTRRQLELVAQMLVQVVVRKRERGALALADARARRIARFVPDPLVMLDRSGSVTWVSPSFSAVAGLGHMAPIGTTLSEISHPQDRSLLSSLAMSTPGTDHAATARLPGPGGSWRWYELRWRLIADDTAGVPDEIVVSLRDVHDRQLQADRLRHDNERDTLTRVLNRVGLEDRLAALDRRGASVAVAFCDLDNFKAFNDGFGHEAGDGLLRSVADALVGAIRRVDLVARIGGDEFVVLIVDPELADCVDLAGRLCAAVNGIAAGVSMSVGVSGRGPASAATQLLQDADGAMYVAKRRARVQSDPSKAN